MQPSVCLPSTIYLYSVALNNPLKDNTAACATVPHQCCKSLFAHHHDVTALAVIIAGDPLKGIGSDIPQRLYQPGRVSEVYET